MSVSLILLPRRPVPRIELRVVRAGDKLFLIGYCYKATSPSPNCNTSSRLSPGYDAVVRAAALCCGGCNPVWWRLQLCVVNAATLCGEGCTPVC